MFIVYCEFSLTLECVSNFRVSTLNVNGARDPRKRANLFELMKLTKIDIMFVQETPSDTLHEADWKKEWEGGVILSHLSRTSGGVALLFSKELWRRR